MLSVPGILGLTPETMPQTVPYLAAEPDRAARWGERVGAAGFRIGIAWQGSQSFGQDRRRSIPLAAFAPLADIPGVRLISLQKGFGSEQIARVPFRVEDLGDDFDAGDAPFLDTAAVMAHLDLVVGIDSVIVHLAGALGVPTILALGPVADWRWLIGREDSPFYPTLRIARQERPGDWADVMARIARAARELARAVETDGGHGG
jgi:hypothetical protein